MFNIIFLVWSFMFSDEKGLVCVKCEPVLCVCVCVCVQFDSVSPVSCVCLCVFTGLCCISLCFCISMLWVQCYVSIFQVFGVSRGGIRPSAGRTRPSSSPVCHEDPHPWQTEPSASAHVPLPRIPRPPWTPAGASYGAV